jgi:hypothetical protein
MQSKIKISNRVSKLTLFVSFIDPYALELGRVPDAPVKIAAPYFDDSTAGATAPKTLGPSAAMPNMLN